MKIKEALEIGEECGLLTIKESLLNIQIHAASLFSYENIQTELKNLYDEFRIFSILYPGINNTRDGIEKFKEYEKYDKQTLLHEADCIERYGAATQMALVGKKAKELREMAELI